MKRPDLVKDGGDQLTFVERIHIRVARRSFEPGRISQALRWLQEHVGRHWVSSGVGRLHHLHHTERLPNLDESQSFILVANHRSFFDMYIITAELLGLGIKQRMVFPVRSRFIYDNPMGLLVNGLMSFFAMYPPIFRERKRHFINGHSMDELVWLLRRGGHFVGFHPEGTRNPSDNPYELLPARAGVGKLIRQAQVPVIPVFTNGLLRSGALAQLRSNFDGSGVPIHTVFGHPIDFGALLEDAPTHSLHKRIAERTREAIWKLGQEEMRIRADWQGKAETSTASYSS